MVEARFGERSGWVIIDPGTARDLLRRRALPKGRSADSRKAVGGYPALSNAEFRRNRSEVVVALARAAADTASMAATLAATIGSTPPSRDAAPAAFTRWMLHHLAGSDPPALEGDLLLAGIAEMASSAEAAQAGITPKDEANKARDALTIRLAERIDTADTAFLTELRERGWSNSKIVEELLGLALAGWESTAAAVSTALALGFSDSPTKAEISELLRLYPPSWLIVRELTGDEAWGQAGELAVVSPWLTHRSAAWHDAHRFDAARTDDVPALPFGAGPHRCPADLYARTQIAVALREFGGGDPRSSQPALIGKRSAALIPDPERAQ